MALTKVSSSLVSDNAVTSGKIADGGIATADIADVAVTTAKIANNAILTQHIDDGQVTTAQLGADAVTADKIANDAISEEHLDVTVITSLSAVTAATGDLLMVADVSDSNNLKKIPVSSILAATHTGPISSGSNAVNVGTVTTTGNLSMATDNATIFIGADLDLRIKHTGSAGTITNNTGDLTLDVAGDLTLDVDGGDIQLKDGGVATGRLGLENGDLNIASMRQDYDIRFKGMDGNTTPFTALKLDMSESGDAFFNADIRVLDDKNIRLGTGQDFRLRFNQTNSFVDHVPGSGALYLRGDTLNITSYTGTENYLTMAVNGAVSLFNNNEVKLSTTSTGINVTGTIQADNLTMLDNEFIRLGNSNDLQIFCDGTDGYIRNHVSGGSIYNRAYTNWVVQTNASDGGADDAIKALRNGAVELYYDNDLVFQTITSGAQIGKNNDGTVRLQLYGTTAADHEIFFGNDGTNGHKDGAIRYFGEANGVTANRRSMTFSTANSERLRIDSAGKIKIGNNIPMWSGSYGGGLFLKGNNATSDRYAQLCIVDSNGAIAQQGLTINNNGSATFNAGVTVNNGHVNIDSGLSYQWGDSHERIEQSDQKIEFFTNNGQQMTLFGGNLGLADTAPFSRLQSGSNTFSGGHGMYTDGRVGISNHGNLTGLMLASTYNDASHPEYGLVFIQGPSTSSYNVWSISPDGPAKGTGLNFHYGPQATNIHAASHHKITFKGDGKIGIGTTIPTAKLQVGSNWTINGSYGSDSLYIKASSGAADGDPRVVNTSDLGLIITSGSSNTSGPDKAGLILHNDDTTAGAFSPMLLFTKRESGSSPYKATMAGIWAEAPTGTGDGNSWIDGQLHFGTSGAATSGVRSNMVINKEGNVGIGTASPDDRLDVMGGGYDQIRIGSNKTDNTNKLAGIVSTTYTNQSVSAFQMFNQNGANTIYYGSADSSHRGIQTHNFYVNTNYNSTSGHVRALQIRSDGDVHAAYTGSADTSGYFYAGKDWGASNHRINRNLTQGSMVLVVSAYGGSGIGADTALFFAAAGGGRNSAATAMAVEKNSSTNRSINAAGTINASGSDYAEYIKKSDTCGAIAKGDICGIDANSKITDKWSEAHSFVVKSTDPSYVGGDSWGTLKRPELTKQGHADRNNPADETDSEYATRTTQHETDLAAFETASEAERVKYDRIAFSGQVPCNLTGASVGDYIIPKEGTSDAIIGEAVSSPTFEQYQKAVGKVWKVLDNGNAWISVKIG